MENQYATREELNYKLEPLKKDIDNLGISHRDHKQEIREDFQNVWKAIDGMLIRVGVVVTIVVSGITLIFKIIEIGINK